MGQSWGTEWDWMNDYGDWNSHTYSGYVQPIEEEKIKRTNTTLLE